jgi:D-proline reductase (dithiol) PrdB
MADWSELPLSLRLFMRMYRWRRIDPVPWAPLRKPLKQSRVAIVSTAGLVRSDQERFDDTVKGGDWSFREIADDTAPGSLIDSHRSESFDHAGLDSDKNLGFPLDRLHELVEANVIGSANHRHLSFMGSITAPGRLIAKSAPVAAGLMVEDQVDAVILIPI